nr:hypothetical protein B0A51_02719 [Rachicladosporium sp. CCFEE 5018]
MLSLPLLPPPDLPTPGLPLLFPRSTSPPASAPQPSTTHHARQTRPSSSSTSSRPKEPTALALLTADEGSLAARKKAIRNFGAYWIRPPGIPKTLQAMHEEEIERREQEELERQERNMADLAAEQQAGELAAARQAGQEGEGWVEGQDGMEDGERDLDAEVPEAEEVGMGDTTEFDESEALTGGSLLSAADAEAEEPEEEIMVYTAMEEAELMGVVDEEAELGLLHSEGEGEDMGERDLDDDVPDAGSYQHTDTEVEDSSDESSLQNSFTQQSARRSARCQPTPVLGGLQTPALGVGLQTPVHGGLQERIRAQVGGETLPRSPGSLDLGSSLLESGGGVGSSPVVSRGLVGGRGRVGGRWRGRNG